MFEIDQKVGDFKAEIIEIFRKLLRFRDRNGPDFETDIFEIYTKMIEISTEII